MNVQLCSKWTLPAPWTSQGRERLTLQSVWTSELEWATQQVLRPGRSAHGTLEWAPRSSDPSKWGMTDKFLGSGFQKLLEWPEPKLSWVRLVVTVLTTQFNPEWSLRQVLAKCHLVSLSHCLDKQVHKLKRASDPHELAPLSIHHFLSESFHPAPGTPSRRTSTPASHAPLTHTMVMHQA